jgi:hypothetical protein
MNPSDGLDQAISAASLVLAVLAALYTLWLGDVSRALDLVKEADPTNRAPQKAQVSSAFYTKALPLLIASLAAVAALFWRTWLIVREVLAHGWAWEYDDVKALFLLTAALLVTLCVVAIAQARGLIEKSRDLKR